MHKIILKLGVNFVFLFLCFLVLFTKNVHAASLDFSPVTKSVTKGDKFTINLVLNVATAESVWGYDAYLKFPSQILSYQDADFINGSVFSPLGSVVHSATADFIKIGSYFADKTKGVTAGGVLATLSFTGVSSGTGNIEVVCGSSTHVYSTGQTQTDLFTSCSSLLPKSTITVASVVAPTVAATSSSTLPDTGTGENATYLIIFGIIVLSGGVLLKKI